MNRIRKAVIPAAGHGTRMFPVAHAIPKEMLPIAGKPMIQYAIEEAIESGIDEVILVLSKGKGIILEYLKALESCTKHSKKLPNIHVAWQQTPRGLADAIFTAREFIQEESFAVILPDALIDSETPCTAQLAQYRAENTNCLVATREVDPDKTNHFGILDFMENETCAKQTVRIKSLVERPTPQVAPSSYGIYGRYILPAEIFGCIEDIEPGFAGELQLTDALNSLAKKVPTYGFLFDGIHYDAGNHLEFLKASVAYALKDSATYPSLSQHLENLLHQRNSQPSLVRLAS